MRILKASILLTSVLVLGACSSNVTDTSVNIGFILEPTGLDPTTVSGAALDQLVIDNVYEGLTFRDQNGEITPKLAKDWDISEDGLTYTFDLQQGVKFHDGSDFTSEDVVATLEASAAEDSKNPDHKLMATFESATAIDEYTVKVTLSEPNTKFLDTLATDAGMIVPSDNAVDLNKESNGTGPYTIGEWATGTSITLERNENYWGEPAKNSEAVFRYYKDQTAATNGLASGEIDILTTYNDDTLSRFENDSNFVIKEGSQTSWMTLGFNSKNEYLKNPTVRQAIRMGIDKDGLISALGGNMMRTGSMTAPGQAWWDESLTKIHTYDPQAAQELLKGAGYEDITLNLRVANNYDSAISEYIKAQLAEIGVTVNIETMEFASWLEEVFQGGDYDMTMVLHVDPWMLTYYANPGYYWNYDNPEVQKTIKAALSAADYAARDKGLTQAARMISEDAASDWLYIPKALTIASTEVSGYPVSRTGSRYPVYQITLAD
ncbi:MAG: ABC transporter substrate-binding protein [Trueperella sp.]|nr:ABC transporter substrate-binding protein [Trueperella sp.]